MSNHVLEIAPDSATLVEQVTAKLAETAREAIVRQRRFTLALSGGSTPKALYQSMASERWKDKFDWQNIEIFFGDDRAVAPDDELSNFRMAKEALFDFVPAKVHRIETENANLEAAAAAYEAKIRELGAPLNVVLLGLGDDGHTASLFPNSPVLTEQEKLVSATPVATLNPFLRRITLTFPAINSAENVWFLVTGAAKAERLKEVLQGEKDVQKLPAQGVDKAVWFLDEAAAKSL
jgi:6-phosphogluconolactonase